MTNYWFGPDDELDAALILSGYVDRYCFQTTYVSKRYCEYYEHAGRFQMIWVLRNPYSTIYSMLYNWSVDGPRQLFEACAPPVLTGRDKHLYKLFGGVAITRLRKACWAYVGKTAQLFELSKNLEPGRIIVVDYDDLVTNKERVLPAIYESLNIPYYKRYASRISRSSLDKADRLSIAEQTTIEAIAEPIYRKARRLIMDT
jgi:hypothetical protein